MVHDRGSRHARLERVSFELDGPELAHILLIGLFSTFASSSPEGIIPTLEDHFHFGDEVGALLIALFVAGYCVGPFVWGPASETVCNFQTRLIVYIRC